MKTPMTIAGRDGFCGGDTDPMANSFFQAGRFVDKFEGSMSLILRSGLRCESAAPVQAVKRARWAAAGKVVAPGLGLRIG